MNKGFSWIIHRLLFALIICFLSSQLVFAKNELKYAGDDAYCDAPGYDCSERLPTCFGVTGNCNPYWRYDSPLRIRTLSPANNTTGVSEATNLIVTMGNGGALQGAGFIYIKRTSDNSTVVSFATSSGALTWGGSGASKPYHGADNILTINPTTPLPSSTSLYVLIDSGAIKNFAGTGFAGISSTTAWKFTTGDNVDPTLVSTVPDDDGVTNDLSANLTATFSENIQRGTGTIRLKNSSGTTIESFTSLTTSPRIAVSGATLTLNPTSPLVAGTSYYITIDSSAIKDMAANTFAGFTDTTTWNFTADTTAPTLSSTVPADEGATGSLNANLTATFNESIAMGSSGTIVLKKTIGDITIETFNIPSASVSISAAATITIDPAAPLEINTDYYLTMSSGVVKDIAGNIYAGYSNATTWNFTTDAIAPTLISKVPADDGATNNLSTNLAATFSENIQLGSGTLELRNASGATLVESFSIPSSTKVSISGVTLTIDPTADLVAGTNYYITITSTAIKDMAGTPNNYAGISGATTWNFAADTAAPILSSTVPADDSSINTLTANLTATFNENIQEGSSGTIVLKKTIGDVTVESFSIPSGLVSASAATITIDPANSLEMNTDYYVTISSGAVEDTAGNDYAGYSNATTWNFTVENIAPILISTVPADDGFTTTTANLTATFSENIQLGSGNIVLKNSSGTTIETFIVPSSTKVTSSGATVTINPTSNLTNTTGYYITISNGTIKDLAGNNYAGFSNATTWNFTADSTAPTKVSTSPLDGATEVAVATNLSITLSENVQKGTGNIIIKKTSDNSVIETIDVTNSIVTISGTTVTIDPSADLLTDTDYYITIASGAIKDLAGNNYAGISATTVWNFITTDTIAPTLISTVPPDDGYGALVTDSLTATFSESIQKNTGTLILKKSSDDSTVQSFSLPSSGLVTTSGATVTIDPTSSLVANTEYYVTVTSGGIEDLAGNDYAGISDATTWNFISVDNIAPTVVSFYPTDNSTGASISGDLVVTFSENIQKGTGNIVIYKTVGNVVVQTIAIGNSIITVSENTMTINPTSNLLLNISYYVTIASTAIKDFAATPNTYAGITATTTWNFTTGATDYFFWGGD